MNAKESRDRFETCLYSKITMFSEIFNIYLLKILPLRTLRLVVNDYLLIFICAISVLCGLSFIYHPLGRLLHHDLNLRCQGRHFNNNFENEGEAAGTKAAYPQSTTLRRHLWRQQVRYYWGWIVNRAAPSCFILQINIVENNSETLKQ